MRVVVFLLLTACGPDAFFTIPPLPDAATEGGDAASDNQTTNEAGEDARADGELEASEDAKPDGPCPTGTAACDDAIVSFCMRMKACCNGQCADAWANAGGSQCVAQFSTSGCSGKMICENACLSDLQSTPCATIKAVSSPRYVSTTCGMLWQ